jgi:pimeloyl-ACP methyl ester carboxylesterase
METTSAPGEPPGLACPAGEDEEDLSPGTALSQVFPWRRRRLTVNGRRMAYVDEGNRGGRPVLLLHGNPNWGVLYRDFIEPLGRAGYRPIVPDWIGAGFSDKPRVDARLTLAHHVADLVALIDGLDLRGFSIVGHDWGGPQGTGALLQRRHRAASLTLMNTWLFTDVMGPFHASHPWTTWHAPLAGQLFQKRYKLLSLYGMTALSVRGPSPQELRAYRLPYDERDSETLPLAWPRTIPLVEGDRGWADMKSIQNRLGELADIPVQLIWADQDAIFTLAYADRLKELIPHAEGPVLFDRAQHFLQDDRGPDVAAELVAFLDRTVGAQL